MAPHDPRETWGQYHKMYSEAEIDLPPNFMQEHPFDNGALSIRDENLAARPRDEQEVRKHIADYYAMITHLDTAVGKVMDELKESDEYENTIFVFAGDNGLAVGQHGLMGKQSLYDHSVRVPLIFAGPGVQAGQRRDDLCYLIDVFPTLCDLAGLETPDTVEGKSLASAVADGEGPGRDHLLLAYTDVQRGVREDRWKLIEYAVGDQRHTQLFDLERDPWETQDLSGEPSAAGEVARLRGKLTAWRDQLDDDRPAQGGDFWARCSDLA
jgi:arylsulfatase A-like enzyme